MESGRSLQTSSERADLSQLTRTPYIQVVTYPRVSLEEAKSRVKQLRNLGVEELVFEGRTRVGRLGILGLGTVGVVVKAFARGGPCALKIRRTDANRPHMDEEVRIATLANRVGVGPEVYAHTRDVIMMKLLEPMELGDWLKGLRGPGSRDRARVIVHGLLNQCRKLDIMGIDHGQLSNLRKHAVIAEGVPWIIDFESAGTSRRPRNVTTAAQYLFIGGAVAPAMKRAIGIRDTGKLKELLASYKEGLSDYAYAKVLESLRLA
ncbi:MAG: serine/threonine protein kinase [Nitrososphaerota archaeon]|nr:serine/threonine protein kinase [Nitrososphaerota archaeon]MDG7014108.1 serine/threonine protein kinase [Nitrososphaerota archaeon]MDG7025451.1 serine/threonine protein kinase [Nitrososphaerota archaeon]